MRYHIPLGTRAALIQIAAYEIFFSVGAIGACIATLAETTELYAMCERYDYDYHSYCHDLNDARYTFSLTSQGLWAGVFIIVSAACKIRFAKVPTKTREMWSTGFSVVAFIMAVALFSLECVALFGGNGNYMDIRELHVAIYSLACMLFVFTLTTMILSSTATKGYCCQTRQNRTVPLGANQMPIMFGNPRGYSDQAFVSHASATVGRPLPGAETQVPHAMGNAHLQNVGAAAVAGQNIAYNATSQQLNSQLPTADYPRQGTVMRPPIQQPQVYPQLWTGNQTSNAYMAATQPMSSANAIRAHQGNQWQGTPQDLPNMKNRDLTAEQPHTSIGGEYAAAGYAYHVLKPGSNANVASSSRATQSFLTANPMYADQSHQGQGMPSHVQTDNTNLATSTQKPEPFPGTEYVTADYQVQAQIMQEQQTADVQQALQQR